MSHFVLVHGAWHGGWCWDRVAPLLQSAGHEVSTPMLAGLGDRASELVPRLGLADHVADVVAVIDGAGRSDVVLVGHSYAGLVVRQAADQRPDAVGLLVLLDAWFGRSGDALMTLAPEWFASAVRQSVGDGWLIPVPPAALVGVDDPADAAWLEQHLTPHPLRTFTDSSHLSGAVDALPTVAIVCEPGSGLPFGERAVARGWPVHRLTAGHDAMVTHPAELARTLLAQVPGRGESGPYPRTA